jgi:ferric-dicitrate binding protein FerR (iron transport regulator)
MTRAEGEETMSDQLNQANSRAEGISAADTSGDETSSRRDFLRAGAVLVGTAAAAPMLSANAQAQGGDAELARVLGERRILIKGGVVLSTARSATSRRPMC